jgi:hypothetical protein
MISVNNIEKQVLSKVHLEYGEDIRPVRDWLVLLAGVAVLFFLSMLWNAWMYIRVVNGESLGGPVSTQPSVDANALTTVENVFAKRTAEEGNYKTVYHFADPSK